MLESKETIRTNVLRSTRWTAGTKAMSQGMTFITTIILANLLAKSDIGLMSMALVYMGFIDTFIDFGFMNAIIQATSISATQLSSCFWLLIVFSILIFIASSLGAPQIAQVFGEERLANMIVIMAFSMLLIPPQILGKGILCRDLRLDIIAKLEFGASLLRAGTSILFAYLGAGVWSLVYGFLIEKSTLSAALLFSAKWKPRMEFDREGLLPLVTFGMNTSMANILWYVYARADFFIIGRILGVEILGVYTIASQFAKAVQQFIAATLQRLIFPLYAKYQQSPHLKEVFLKSSVFLAVLSAPLVVGVAALAPDVVELFLDERWQETVVPMRALSIVSTIMIITYLFSAALSAIGRPDINTHMNFYSTIAFCGSFYLGALWLGINGILLTWVILYPLRFLAYLIITARFLDFPVLVYFKRHMGTALATIIMFLAVILVQHIGSEWNILIRMTLCIATGAVVYLSLQAWLSGNAMRELFGLVKEMAYPAGEAARSK